jgi:exopolysaccharide production protein ExoQ
MLSHSTHDLELDDPEFDSSMDESPTPIEGWLDRVERGFVVLAILYQTGCLYSLLSWNFSTADPMTTRTDAPMEVSSPAGGLMRYFILLCLGLLLVVRWRLVWQAAKRRKALWLLMGWLILSCSWSINPNSQKLANEIVSITVTGIYFAARFPLRQMIPLAALGFGISVGMNFLFCLAFPQFGIQVGMQEGAWRGMLIQKNSLACLVVFAAIPLLCTLFSEVKRDRAWYWLGLVISALLVVMSNSKTGLLIFLMITVLIPIFQKMRSRSYLALPMFICAMVAGTMVALLLLGNYEEILLGLGRDPSLSGRTEIWEAMAEKIMQQPITGYGYNGFWLAREGESLDIWYRSKDLPPHGHNGYLNLTLDLGLTGLGLFLASYLKAFQRSFVWLRWTTGPEGLMPILFMSVMLIYNMTEEVLIANANFNAFWLFYVYLTTAILINPVRAEALEGRSDDIDHNWESTADFPQRPVLDSEVETP